MREEKIDFWKNKGKNVLLTGPTGVGKTQLVLEGMVRSGVSLDTNVAQWSAPLLDFVGVKAEDADVLYFDKYGDEKSIQAVEEIISLRRWKGVPIKPTAVVWASHTSPWNGEVYAEPPRADVFDVCVSVPNRPCHPYFEAKYGKAVSEVALRWWDFLPVEDQRAVSPRKLDMAIAMWKDKGDIRDVLPLTVSPIRLIQNLNMGPVAERLKLLRSG